MRAKIVRLLFVALGLLAILLVILFGYQNKKNADEQQLIFTFNSSLPMLQQEHVRFFFDGNWCKVLVYGQRKVSKTLQARSANEDCGTSLTGLTNFQPFAAADTELFNRISASYESRDISVTVDVGDAGQIVKVDFELGGFNSPSGYIFEPNYRQLPTNTPYEDEYERIDNDWYRHFQDAL